MTGCNETTGEISYPKRKFEPDDAFPLGAPRSSSPPLRSDTQIVKERARGGLVTSLLENTTGRQSKQLQSPIYHALESKLHIDENPKGKVLENPTKGIAGEKLALRLRGLLSGND